MCISLERSGRYTGTFKWGGSGSWAMRTPLLLALALVSAGCLGADTALEDQVSPEPATDPLVTLHTPNEALPLSALPEGLLVPQVVAGITGHTGAEPTIGVTSDGSIFIVAMTHVIRSQDDGATWEIVHEFPRTLDPMLWVDPLTDRVFVNHLYVACSVLAWSDDLGESWTTNPIACGVPVNDHQKVATAPPREGATLQPTGDYPNLVYYAYNGIALGSRVSISLDGGLTFPINSETVPANHPNACSGGLHGHLESAPDGTLYLPKRSCDGVLVARSLDSGFSWGQTLVGDDVGSTDCRKNPEIATDTANNAYVTWPAADQELYLAHTTDGGGTWGPSVRASPPEMEVTTMPVMKAGDPGRLAIAYYGIERDQTADEVPDRVNETGRWHLYVTYTLNALDPEPTFVTVQATPDEDPVQIGPISTNSGCDNPPGSRNLLDFIDLALDGEGRAYVTYTDGCVEACTEPDATMEDSRSREVAFALVAQGPSLFEEVGQLSMPASGVSTASVVVPAGSLTPSVLTARTS